MAKFLGEAGLVYLWSRVKSWVGNYVRIVSVNNTKTLIVNTTSALLPTKTSELTNDSGFITDDDIPEGSAASTTLPKMDGAASTGSENAFARGDHRHPSDTSKQDTIEDLDTIRSNAAAGANALQASEKGAANGICPLDENSKVDPTYLPETGGAIESISVNGTPQTIDVNKNVDITVPDELADLTADSAHRTVTDTEKSTWNNKQAAINDLSDIREGAALGATALQSETDPVFSASVAAGITNNDISNWNSKTSNIGTITGITMNGASKGTSGVVDLGTVITAHQDISGKADKATTLNGYGITDAKIENGIITLGNNTITPLTSYTETDPTVPSWAKASSKPSYTASEVGAVPTTRKVNGKALSADITLSASDVSALPSSTAIPSKTSDLTNDSGYITSADISGVYKYKGSKTNYSNLPTSGNVTGDVWNVVNAYGDYPAGTNFAWTGSAWDALGGSVDLSGYVPTSRTINGKALSSNITLSASDVSALPSSTVIPDELSDLSDDATHRLVTDTEKTTWSGAAEDVNGNTINGSSLTDSTSYWFGTSSTAAATVEKEVSIPSIKVLNAGQIIVVKPTVTSTVASSTLKLNSFDAYPMLYNNAAITTSTDSIVWSASYPSIWLFDGEHWVFLAHGVDSNTTYSTMSVAEGTTGTATSARTVRADYLKQIIEAHAPQADWEESDSTDPAYIKNKPTIPSKTSDLTNDSGFITEEDIPEGSAASTTTPKMDGTAEVGTETRFARGDHRHPTDTSRQAVITSSSKLSADLIEDGTTNKTVTATEKSTWDSKGTYSKPSGGIPKTDLATAVQTSLGLADTALQSYTETDPVFAASAAHGISSTDISNWNAKGTYSKPSGGIPKTDLASAVQTSLGLADTALQSYTETDPTVPSWAKASSKPTYTASEVGALPDTTVIPTESTVSGWGFTKNAGTITGVTGSNGLTGSGTSGSVTISHAAPATAPTKSTSAVYPITIDQYGHITAAGSAVTIPAAPGTLKTNNTTAQTASSSEALSGTINLHKVAKTGTYSDLIGTPTIPTVPTNVSAFTNDANYVSSDNTVAIYSGSSAPSSSTGKNGDIYIQTS